MQSADSGPELLLQPHLERLRSSRDDSPVRRPEALLSIPTHEILVVESASKHVVLLTTLSLGYYQCSCPNRNAYDILLAFLQTTVPHERILDVDDQATLPSQSSSCLDMDGLTAKYMQPDRETWSLKRSRRMGRLSHSLQELSGSICDYTTCCAEEVREEPDVYLELDEGSYSAAR